MGWERGVENERGNFLGGLGPYSLYYGGMANMDGGRGYKWGMRDIDGGWVIWIRS